MTVFPPEVMPPPPPALAPEQWVNRFAALPPAFHTRLQPSPLPAPYWVGRNRRLAAELGLEAEWLERAETMELLTGNHLLPGMDALASVYSGHQFGVWAGQLGDGRAILLGETRSGHEWQLKGSGRTPYSRMGDGRAVLRSSIREFLCSEAMQGLGIPSTRALAVTGSDAPVRRETVETAAVVTRLAPSFVRFGHFEHFSARGDIASLRQLADQILQNFYPECLDDQTFAGNPYAALLQAVSERTAQLLARWQASGFCHGVMNTDNMSILGLTLDYGPFQFLDAFQPGHICNHSDTLGRYAFDKQPNIAYWNLFCLAQALLPLIGEQDLALAALESYKTVFPSAYQTRMLEKLGWAGFGAEPEQDQALIDSCLQLLATAQADYPLFWRRLSQAIATQDFAPVRDLLLDRAAFDAWLISYQAHGERRGQRPDPDLMLRSNPKYVLRNHLAEIAIQKAQAKDFSEVQTLLKLVESPFDEHPEFDRYANLPPAWAASIEISCSS